MALTALSSRSTLCKLLRLASSTLCCGGCVKCGAARARYLEGSPVQSSMSFPGDCKEKRVYDTLQDSGGVPLSVLTEHGRSRVTVHPNAVTQPMRHSILSDSETRFDVRVFVSAQALLLLFLAST